MLDPDIQMRKAGNMLNEKTTTEYMTLISYTGILEIVLVQLQWVGSGSLEELLAGLEPARGN